MDFVEGRVVFITGGASGIGLGAAQAFGRAGMKVMIADVDEGALGPALESLRSNGVAARAVCCDVSDPASVQAAADTTLAAFGRVDVLFNNAGVGGGGSLDRVGLGTWRWMLAVNVMGVVHGVAAFLPLIRAHGQGGHIVNTASMAGLISLPGMEAYAASKAAVVSVSEGWRDQLAPEGIGVSVLCPGAVVTRILESSARRPSRFAADGDRADVAESAAVLAVWERMSRNRHISPQTVGELVLEGVRNDEPFIFTHPEYRADVEERHGRLMQGFDAADASRVLLK